MKAFLETFLKTFLEKISIIISRKISTKIFIKISTKISRKKAIRVYKFWKQNAFPTLLKKITKNLSKHHDFSVFLRF